MKKFLSMGWGVQTFAMCVMCVEGDLEMPDAAIFGDPQNEGSETYKFKKEFEGFFESRGLKMVTGTRGNIVDMFLNPKKRAPSMPMYTLLDGKPGMIRRQCTRDFKVEAVLAEIRKLMGIKSGREVKEPAELWLGISRDEVIRMKESGLKWIQNRWPLVEKKFTRGKCVEYLKKKGYPVPPKSSCIVCPFHSDSYWLDMKRNNKKEWDLAVDFDKKARRVRPGLGADLYLHKSLVPLDEVNLNEDQMDMFGEECEGHCGL